MPLQTQSASLLPGQENLLVPQQSKTVSFQTPAAAAKKSKTTGRRAFGDISNRKLQQSSQFKSEVTKPAQSTKPSIRLERKASASAKSNTAPKQQQAKPSSTSTTTKSTKKIKHQVYESIELPYGPTGSELDELYDSDGHVSVCSMEKEGILFSRRDTAALFREGMVQRRKEDDQFLESMKKSMDDDSAALACQDGTCVCVCLV